MKETMTILTCDRCGKTFTGHAWIAGHSTGCWTSLMDDGWTGAVRCLPMITQGPQEFCSPECLIKAAERWTK